MRRERFHVPRSEAHVSQELVVILHTAVRNAAGLLCHSYLVHCQI